MTRTNREDLELAIGETREHEGVTLKATPITTTSCGGCHFNNAMHFPCITTGVYDIMGECGAPWRKDRKSMVFKEVSE